MRLRLLLPALIMGCSAAAADAPPEAANAATGAVTFADLNGVTWLYTTENDLRFHDVTAKLDDYKAHGTRVLGIYAPYNGSKKKWLGAGPLDFYATAPQSGTVEDFSRLVAAAHERGMKIVTYFVAIYIDRESAFFRKAEQQYKAGDRTSPEVSAFRWSADSTAAMPQPSAGPSCDDPDLEQKAECTQWRFSDTAGAYYWSLWGEAGFDYNLPGARAEVERAMRFWLDKGVDGFMFDAAYADPKFKALLADLPKAHSPSDKWLTFESTAAEDRAKLDAFGLTSWFNASDDDEANDYSFVANGSDSPDDLERSFQNADFARARGKTTFAWTILEGSYPNELAMRAQEAALLAGAGLLYGTPDATTTTEKWPADVRASWEAVLGTINAHKALLPSASRSRVPATGAKSYAMTRTSKDGSESALLVFNLKGTRAQVKLDLASSGLSLSQTPKDLHRAKAMPAIHGASYTLDLPAYGFEILGVQKL